MGGGASRFEETNWQHANGYLKSSEETIDGAEPTPAYGVYYLNKRRNVNQREYDVTDMNSNLLYTTRCIEGTLAWFDVLGPALDQYLLRVQVDLSRRYWVIYKFGQPCFAGQFADMQATERLRQARGHLQPCLYKKCCITVSWSRYHAIVNNYGPPPAAAAPQQQQQEREEEVMEFYNQKEKQENDESQQEKGSKGNVVDNAFAPVTPNPMAAANAISPDKGWQPPVVNECQLRTKEDLPPPAWLVESEKHLSNLLDSYSDVMSCGGGEMPRNRTATDDSSSLDSSSHHKSTSLLKSKSMKRLKKWIRSTGGVTTLTGTVDLLPKNSPLEGYLQLDKPILKVEEINSILGQHQTMLIDTEEGKQYVKQQQLLEAAKAGADAHNPDANLRAAASSSTSASSATPPEKESSFSRIRKWMTFQGSDTQQKNGADTEKPPRDDNNDDDNKKSAYFSPFGGQKKSISKDLTETQYSMPSISMTPLEETAGSPPLDSNKPRDEEKKDDVRHVPPADDDDEQPSKVSSFNNENGPEMKSPQMVGKSRLERDEESSSALCVDPLQQVPQDDAANEQPSELANNGGEEPLVGFWSWENTVRVHKMKLHVAKGCDLALHVVLAIVTNQLRLERNVVVSTV